MKQPHDRLFIQGVWTYAGWIDRIGMMIMYLFLIYISIQGWLK